MKLLIALSLLGAPLIAMDKPGSSPRKDEKHKKPEKSVSPREEKQKEILDKKHGSDIYSSNRTTKSESPQKGSSPLRANTVGKKRGSLDYNPSLSESLKQMHLADVVKSWSEKDPIEDRLERLWNEAQDPHITAERQRVLYCEIMNTPSGVSRTKERLATIMFLASYKTADACLYNIPGYYQVKNYEEARLEIGRLYAALYAAKEHYIDKLAVEVPKREKYVCEKVVCESPQSPIVQLKKRIEEVKLKLPDHAKDFEIKSFELAEFKKP